MMHDREVWRFSEFFHLIHNHLIFSNKLKSHLNLDTPITSILNETPGTRLVFMAFKFDVIHLYWHILLRKEVQLVDSEWFSYI